MSEQHFSAAIYIGDYLVTGQLSDKQFEQIQLSDDLQAAHRVLSGKLQKVEEHKETELMQVEAEFDVNEPLDDIPVDGEEAENGEENSEGGNAVKTVSVNSDSLMSRLSNEQRIELMNKKQEIENRYSNEEQQLITDSKIVEDNINKKITMNDTVIQVLEATKQTYDDYLDQTNMGYSLSC